MRKPARMQAGGVRLRVRARLVWLRCRAHHQR